jgi:hypothetical protein
MPGVTRVCLYVKGGGGERAEPPSAPAIGQHLVLCLLSHLSMQLIASHVMIGVHLVMRADNDMVCNRRVLMMVAHANKFWLGFGVGGLTSSKRLLTPGKCLIIYFCTASVQPVAAHIASFRLPLEDEMLWHATSWPCGLRIVFSWHWAARQFSGSFMVHGSFK